MVITGGTDTSQWHVVATRRSELWLQLLNQDTSFSIPSDNWVKVFFSFELKFGDFIITFPNVSCFCNLGKCCTFHIFNKWVQHPQNSSHEIFCKNLLGNCFQVIYASLRYFLNRCCIVLGNNDASLTPLRIFHLSLRTQNMVQERGTWVRFSANARALGNTSDTDVLCTMWLTPHLQCLNFQFNSFLLLIC